jgi:hypothetical protein
VQESQWAAKRTSDRNNVAPVLVFLHDQQLLFNNEETGNAASNNLRMS